MKNIRDQITEGLTDGDTVEDLLKEKDLTLNKAITTCCAQEDVKRQRAEITQEVCIELSIQTIRQTLPYQVPPPSTCLPWLWWYSTKEAGNSALPTTWNVTLGNESAI